MVSFHCGIVAACLTGPAPWQDNKYPQIDSGESNILQDTGAKGARWAPFRIATLHGHPSWKQYLVNHGVFESVRRQQCTDWIAVRLDCTPGSASKRWAWSTRLLQPRFNRAVMSRAVMSRDLHSICGKVGNQQPSSIFQGNARVQSKKFYGQWLRSGGQRKNCGGQWMQSNAKKIAADPEWHSTHPRSLSCFLGAAITAYSTWIGQNFPPVPWWTGKFLILAMTKNVVLLTVPWHKQEEQSSCPKKQLGNPRYIQQFSSIFQNQLNI